MFQHMADQTRREASPRGSVAPAQAEAEFATARFRALSAEIRGCAILGPDGVLAATGDREGWADPAADLLRAADAAAGGTASHAHVATEEGEAFAIRLAGLAMVAVTDRFTLGSLLVSDMRVVMREVGKEKS